MVVRHVLTSLAPVAAIDFYVNAVRSFRRNAGRSAVRVGRPLAHRKGRRLMVDWRAFASRAE
jgi:hypothetical protein